MKVTSGWIDLPNITLNAAGDWAIFVATVGGSANSVAGTVFSIGTPSDTLFRTTGHLTLSWCGSGTGNNPWSNGYYAKTFVATGRDDGGVKISDRHSNPGGSSTFFGVAINSGELSPLVSHQSMGNDKASGVIIQKRGGVVELWAVDATGPRLMDSSGSGSDFTGITNKPFRVAAAHMVTQPSSPSTYWRQSIQGLVVYNGGSLTPIQMQKLYNGASAQNVLDLQASRDDRYYPGTVTAGVLTEMVGNKHGTPTGTLAPGASILPANLADDVIVDMDGAGQVVPRDPPPATTTKVRFWGTRIGYMTDIRMRVIKSNAPDPVVEPSDVIVDWTTVASGVQNEQTWIGEIPGMPHAFANYQCEVSWKDQNGDWLPAQRVSRSWTVGVVATIAGQSIVQQARSLGGSTRTFNSAVQGYMRAYYDIAQNSRFNMNHTHVQGWLTRPNSTSSEWGENRMLERLALLTNSPVGLQNCAVGGSPISPYVGESSERWIRWKRFIQRARPQVIIWGNGHGDAAMSRTDRFDRLDQLLAQVELAVQTAPGGPWNYEFQVFPVNGNTRQTNLDSIRSHDIEWAKSRAAQGKPVGVNCEVLEGATLDGVHLKVNDAGHGLLASRMAQSIAHAVGLAAYSGRGPEVDRGNSTWTSAGGITTVDLPIIPNGGTGLATGAGGAPTGFRVRLDSNSATVPTTAEIISPTLIRLTATGTAVNSVKVTYQEGRPGYSYGTDSATGAAITKTQTGTVNAVYDNRGDITSGSTGIPGFPMPPITSADPLIIPQTQSAISVSDVTVNEPANGATTATFTLTLSIASAFSVNVDYTTVNGTAVEGTNYVAQSGAVTFPIGSTSQEVTVTVNGDTLNQLTGTFSLTLGNPVNAIVADATGVATVNAYDSDRDRMPNAWETQYGFNPGNGGDASIDSDGDGMTNLQEYLAETHPGDSSDYFRVSAIGAEGNDVVITFNTAAEKTYRLEGATDLIDWSPLGTIPGTGGAVELTDVGARSVFPRRFYRIVLLP